MVPKAVEAAERLATEHGVDAEVIDLRSLVPLDTATILASVRKTSRAMVVYEDNRTYGAGAEIAASIAEDALFDLDAPIVRIGGPDIPAMPYAAALEHFYTEPTPDHLYRAMLDLARY
jgi:2-oxoisovalerate dehydrogenase E1 component beta subunit